MMDYKNYYSEIGIFFWAMLKATLGLCAVLVKIALAVSAIILVFCFPVIGILIIIGILLLILWRK